MRITNKGVRFFTLSLVVILLAFMTGATLPKARLQEDLGIELSPNYIQNSSVLYESDVVSIDYGNINSGYIIVQSKLEKDARIGITYNGQISTFIVEGQTVIPINRDGDYQVSYLRHLSENSYSKQDLFQINVALNGTQYAHPNSFVPYSKDDTVVAFTKQIASYESENQRIKAIWQFVTGLQYDAEKAEYIKENGTTYPDNELTLALGKGVCSDIASLAVAMLRIAKVDAVVVHGLYQGQPHAWIEVSSSSGHLQGDIHLDGDWTILDPTNFANKEFSYNHNSDYVPNRRY